MESKTEGRQQLIPRLKPDIEAPKTIAQGKILICVSNSEYEILEIYFSMTYVLHLEICIKESC